MLDKKNEPYYEYIERLVSKRLSFDCGHIRKLAEKGFSGKVTVDFGEIVINFRLGGVTNLNKRFEPEPSMVVEESVKLK